MYIRKNKQSYKGKTQEYFQLVYGYRNEYGLSRSMPKTLGKTEKQSLIRLKEFLKEDTEEPWKLTQDEFEKLKEALDTDIWGTPDEILEKVRVVFGEPIALDPCTHAGNPTGALKFFTEKDDGLKQVWKANNIYMNPPYSEPEKWLRRLVEVYKDGQVKQAIALVKTGVS